MVKKVLITGGVRSGKSRYAMSTALSYPTPRVFLATAEPLDEEMRSRIVRHQAERKDQFLTIEEPLDPAEKILRMDFPPAVVLMDCLTIWVGNLYHHFRGDDSAIQSKVDRLAEVIENVQHPLILVTNEIGSGLISDHTQGRRFVDTLGALNQKLAQICDEVILMTCGIPQILKGTFQNAKVGYGI